jgi:hypothetical protein
LINADDLLNGVILADDALVKAGSKPRGIFASLTDIQGLSQTRHTFSSAGRHRYTPDDKAPAIPM